MDWLTLQWLGDVGSTTVVIIFVLAILTGRLRPQSVITELRADRDARIAEIKAQYSQALEISEIWKTAYQTTEAARKDQAKVLDEIVSTVKHIQSAAVNLPASTGGERPDDLQT